MRGFGLARFSINHVFYNVGGRKGRGEEACREEGVQQYLLWPCRPTAAATAAAQSSSGSGTAAAATVLHARRLIDRAFIYQA